MLLLFNLRNVGHFTIYCHNLTLWALSRRIEVSYCGLDVQDTAYYARFFAHPNVRFLDMRERLDLGTERLDDAAIVQYLCKTAGGMVRQVEQLRRLQCELSPSATVLVNADEFLFNFPFERSSGDLFAAPTYGVLTFGYRDRYTGYDEKYAWRLRRVPRDGSLFARLLTIDEYHAVFEDPTQPFLVHLPDPYREWHAEGELGADCWTHPDAVALRSFLDLDDRPVLPIAGKFDERKNNLWLLEEVAARPGLRCVVIGERIPSPALDSRIDSLLDGLEQEGRLFCRFGFVPHALFDILFSSPHVTFAAFPYLAHYGSSGIHLMAAEYAKPCLVPDSGLMGRRTRDARLGLLFRHGDRSDFRRQFARLLDGECWHDPQDFAAFATAFDRESLFMALDYTFGLSTVVPALPFWTQGGHGEEARDHVDVANEALDLAYSGEGAAALVRLDQALALAPDHASLLLRRFTFLLRTGDLTVCLSAWRKIKEAGGAEDETRFFVERMTEYVSGMPFGEWGYDEDMLLSLLTHIAEAPDALQSLGGVLAKRGAYTEAEAAFVRALLSDPSRDDIWLNLSDVRRYAGRLTESHAALDELAHRSPDTPGLWCKRGQVLAAEGRVTEAVFALDREIATGGPFVELAALWRARLA